MSAAQTRWPNVVIPVAALASVALFSNLDLVGAATPAALRWAGSALLIAVLFAAVFAAVHHAELIAHRVGEPYGTLVLTIAVTVIEVALITSILLGDKPAPALARDTVFSVIMIVCNGLVGLCILLGGLRYGEQGFRARGTAAYLTVLAPLSVLTLVLPNFTETTRGPVYSIDQLIYVSVVTLVLYAAFLYIQTYRHRDYFDDANATPLDEAHSLPSNRSVAISFVLLLVALVAVILLSKQFAQLAQVVTARVGAPETVVGILVALLILMPEGVAACRAARADRLQQSLNLALGSTLATIGLTIPAVAAISIVLNQTLVLGLETKDMVLLFLTLLVSALTFGTGRTNILSGFVHLVLFATFVFLALVP